MSNIQSKQIQNEIDSTMADQEIILEDPPTNPSEIFIKSDSTKLSEAIEEESQILETNQIGSFAKEIRSGLIEKDGADKNRHYKPMTVLIDGENTSDKYMKNIIEIINDWGYDISDGRVYGDFMKGNLTT